LKIRGSRRPLRVLVRVLLKRAESHPECSEGKVALQILELPGAENGSGR
jgi:hypothetical protein